MPSLRFFYLQGSSEIKELANEQYLLGIIQKSIRLIRELTNSKAPFVSAKTFPRFLVPLPVLINDAYWIVNMIYK